MNEESKALTPVTPDGETAILSEQDIQAAEKQAALAGRMVAASVACTNKFDWLSIDDHPYPAEGAVHKLCALWGVELGETQMVEDKKKDARGEWIIYTVQGPASRKGRTSHYVGTAHTRLPFYGTRTEWIEKDGKREKIKKDVPLEDVDLANVRKHAWTNWAHNALTKLVGLRNMQWSDLERTLGADQVKWIREERSVDHRKKEQDKSASDSTATADKRQAIRRACLILAAGDPEAAKKVLFEATTWTDKEGKVVNGKQSVKELSEKQIEFHFPNLTKRADETLAKLTPDTKAALLKNIDEFLAGAK